MTNTEEVKKEETAIAVLRSTGMALTMDQLLAGLRTVAADTDGSDGGLPLLKIKKIVGTWRFGQSNSELVGEGVRETREGKSTYKFWDDIQIQVHSLTMEHGWVCWKDGEPVSRMGSIFLERPSPGPDQGPHTKGDRAGQATKWEEQYSVEITVLTGEHEGTRLLYKSNAKGALAFFGTLVKHVTAKALAGGLYFFPVICPSVEVYEHKTYGDTAKPNLNVLFWNNQEGEQELEAPELKSAEEAPEDDPEAALDAELVESEDAPAEEAKPKTRRRAAPK